MRTSSRQHEWVANYAAYGLRIRSALPLPGLTAGEGEADVEILFGRVGKRDLPAAPEGGFAQIDAQDAHLSWEEVGSFRMRGGRELLVDPAPGADERLARLVVLGAPLAILIRQRGRLVLHASAVVGPGGVVAFLGGCGKGKSSVAAALAAQGWPLVSDDMVVVDTRRAASLLVYPGFPQLKLDPEVVSALRWTPGDGVEFHPEVKKRGYRVDGGFAREPLPLKQVYVLMEGDVHEVSPLAPHERLIELVRHTYRVRSLGTEEAPSHFRQCALVANQVPVSFLRVKNGLASLPALAKVVEKDLGPGL